MIPGKINNQSKILNEIISVHNSWRPELNKEAWERLKNSFRTELLLKATEAKAKNVLPNNYYIFYELLSSDANVFKPEMLPSLVSESLLCSENLSNLFKIEEQYNELKTYKKIRIKIILADFFFIVATVKSKHVEMEKNQTNNESKKTIISDNESEVYSSTYSSEQIIKKRKLTETSETILSGEHLTLEINAIVVTFIKETCVRCLKKINSRSIGIDLTVFFLLFTRWAFIRDPKPMYAIQITEEIFNSIVTSKLKPFINKQQNKYILMGHICTVKGLKAFPTYIVNEEDIGQEYAPRTQAALKPRPQERRTQKIV